MIFNKEMLSTIYFLLTHTQFSLNLVPYKINKHRNLSRRNPRPQISKSNATNNNKSLWNMLPQGLPALNLEFIKETGNIFKWPEKVRKTLETKELSDYQNKKIATASQMSDYVSNMMKDYITSDNIWKTVVKTTPVSIFTITNLISCNVKTFVWQLDLANFKN